ncbi:hypothetical protein AAFP30_05565 [Gordonia sp. CPCC 205515]|uniref:hypothetical protein n=1 Tax=Gordonia sp. CPCC 205515 TaxID=3140791 RepID=UPI003AF3E071
MTMRSLTASAAALIALVALGVGPGAADASPTGGPQLGQRCIGADIGRTALDARGNSIICDNYRWRLNHGQRARHPWVDDQVEWAECTAKHSVEWCRQQLNTPPRR